MSNLEQRIAKALNGSSNLNSQALSQLLVDTERAIAAAEQAAAQQRVKALDPLQSPDLAAARQALADAEFAAQRLQSLLPKLQARLNAVHASENYREWAAKFEQLVPRHRAAAARLKAIYQQVEAELVPALTEAKQVDQELARIANAKPYHLPQANGDNRTLPTVECTARGVSSVNPDFSLMNVKLPAFDKPNQLAWPPYEVPLALQLAVPTLGDPRSYTGEWWRVQQERRQAARQQQQREQDERQAEADAAYQGPRWWTKPDRNGAA
jgi:hypothetical protein